jgi:tetratricopeptide (TPR) repeat protein
MNNKTILSILGIFIWIALPGQDMLSKQELKQRIKEGKYEEAFEPLELLRKEYPKDPEYIYYSGICRVQSGTDIPKAVEFLSETSLQPSYYDSWLYLGRAYMMNYEFDKAEEAFNRFDEKAGRLEKERLHFTMYRTMCRNAREIYRRSKKVKVLKTDTLAETELWSFLNKQPISGRFTGMNDSDQKLTNAAGGIRFSGAEMILETRYTFGKRQKDIYFSEGDDALNDFKNAGKTVNSPYDETLSITILPFRPCISPRRAIIRPEDTTFSGAITTRPPGNGHRLRTWDSR